MRIRGLAVLGLSLIGYTASCKCGPPPLRVYHGPADYPMIVGAGYGLPLIDSVTYAVPLWDSIRVRTDRAYMCWSVDLQVYRNDSLLFSASESGSAGITTYVSGPGRYKFVARSDGWITVMCIVDLTTDLFVGLSQEPVDAKDMFTLQGVARDLQLSSLEPLPFRLELFNTTGALIHSVTGVSGPETVSLRMPLHIEGMIVAVATWPTAIISKRVFIGPL